MRWIYYTLMIANLVFFGWHIVGGRDDEFFQAENVDARVARIKLLAEVEGGVEGLLQRRPEVGRCDVYGPFFSASDSRAFLAAVKKAGLAGWVEQEQVSLKSYYWAYILPLSSSSKTNTLINRLRGDRFDAEFIGEGHLKRGVSLGNFESVELVEALGQRLLKFDVQVKFEEKSRNYKQFWVLLKPEREAEMSAALRDGLIASYPDIFHKQKTCKPVASG